MRTECSRNKSIRSLLGCQEREENPAEETPEEFGNFRNNALGEVGGGGDEWRLGKRATKSKSMEQAPHTLSPCGAWLREDTMGFSPIDLGKKEVFQDGYLLGGTSLDSSAF